MRFISIIIIWIVLIGGMTLFMNSRPSTVPIQEIKRDAAQGDFWLDVTTTFDAQPDPFALSLDDSSSATALLVKVDGDEILREEKSVQAGSVIQVKPVSQLKVGQNEFFIEANPPASLINQAHAVRCRIFNGSSLLKEQTVWSQPGLSIVSTFSIDLENQSATKEDDHDH